MSSRGRQKIIGSTHQISEFGLIILVPALPGGEWRVAKDQQLQIEMEPERAQEVVQMRVVVLGGEPAEKDRGEEGDRLIIVQIESMSHNQRAHYLEFLGGRW